MVGRALSRQQPGELASVLRARREELGLTRPDVQVRTQKLGPRSGVSAAYLEKIELGYQSRPSATKLAVLAETYGLDIGDLLRLAGYVPGRRKATPPEFEEVQQAIRAMRSTLERDPVLTRDDRDMILRHFEHIRRMREREGKRLARR